MRIAVGLSLSALLALGCDQGPGASGPMEVGGTVTSLSPGSAQPPLLSLIWIYDEGMGDQALGGGGTAVPAALPAKFSFTVQPPQHYWVDFDDLRALPSCTDHDPPDTRCWPADRARILGHGKLAVGGFAVFDDADGNGQYTDKPMRETLRGLSSLFVLYAQDLDAQATKELGDLMILNAGSLHPGFNFARVRCKDQVGWKGGFDPFEVVPEQPITVESLEAQSARMATHELCNNWS
ncbi:MAG TPA: hypothetical protein VN914_02785 [Polyangia bacterium]|nr:hypothetical protein [Polyangia bacterium]